MHNAITGSQEETAHGGILILIVKVEIIQAAITTISIANVMLTDLPISTGVTIIQSSIEEEMIPV
jgi:hypothetical protein